MDSDEKRRLRDDWESSTPADEVSARARRSTLAATPRGRRGFPRWSRRTAIAIALVTAAAVGVASAAVVRPWERPPATSAANETAAARILADPLLRSFPWAVRDQLGPTRLDDIERRISLTFPPGVGRAEAVADLYRAVIVEGRLPEEATEGPPLPEGVALRLSDERGGALTLDPALAFGYDVPGGRVQEPSWVRGSGQNRDGVAVAIADAAPPYPGSKLFIPHLPTCQTIRPGMPTAPCELSDPPPHPWDGPVDAATVKVPDLVGKPAGEAAAMASAAGLRVRILGVFSPETANLFDRTGEAVPLSVMRDADAWRKNVPVVNTDGDPPPPGTVVAVHPAPGEPVRGGARLVVAAMVDDCYPPDLVTGPNVLQADCIPGSEAARQASPELHGARWLYSARRENRIFDRKLREVPRQEALRFPPGVTRAQALQRLYSDAVIRGRLPREATLVEPLPHGLVYREPTAPDEGITIDLRAPFGYDPDRGTITNMGMSFRADRSRAQLAAGIAAETLMELPTPLEEQILPILPLPPCQVATAEHPRATCAAAKRR